MESEMKRKCQENPGSFQSFSHSFSAPHVTDQLTRGDVAKQAEEVMPLPCKSFPLKERRPEPVLMRVGIAASSNSPAPAPLFPAGNRQ